MTEAEAETEITHRFSQMDWFFEGKMFRFTSRIGICKSYVHIHIGQGGWCNVVWGAVGLCCWISKLHLKYMDLWKYFRATRMHSSRVRTVHRGGRLGGGVSAQGGVSA